MRGEPRGGLFERIDSVYMLMWPGWATELRSNRWHYGRRWARYRPTVMIQPERRGRGWVARPEHRIPNCTVLSVLETSEDARWRLEDALVQAGQIGTYMRAQGHERPLLWLYNPALWASFAMLPAAVRAVHATENYFGFHRFSALALDEYRAVLGASDCVVAVSSGVVDALHEHAAPRDVLLAPNGCDYEEYAAATPSRRFEGLRAHGFERILVYGGNINDRLDYRLLTDSARRYPLTAFAFFGPVVGQDASDATAWRELLRFPNVRHFGPVPAEELPGIYAAADAGLIPYKRTPFLEAAGFPLKALEMAAAGLPVVSTYMRPLEAIESVITMTRSADEFLECVGRRNRAALGAAEREGMDAACRARGYDRLFETVVERLGSLATTPVTRADALIQWAGPGRWSEALTGLSDTPSRAAARLAYRRLTGARPARAIRRAWRLLRGVS